MKEGYISKTYFCDDIKADCILVDNCESQNKVKNWHFDLHDAYLEKGDCFSIGVWKIKNLKQ